jgi:hypothetical protein
MKAHTHTANGAEQRQAHPPKAGAKHTSAHILQWGGGGRCCLRTSTVRRGGREGRGYVTQTQSRCGDTGATHPCVRGAWG